MLGNSSAGAAGAAAIDDREKSALASDVEKAIDRFIDRLQELHAALRDSSGTQRKSRSADINQISAGEVLRLVDETYLRPETGLHRFDTFAGELWTRDRLKVALLGEAERRLPPYFNGVGAKGPDIEDLRAVMHGAARQVYARAAEMSEIVGVSHSFDRFLRTVSENSDQVPPVLHAIGAEARYEGLLPGALRSLEMALVTAGTPSATADRSGTDRRFQYRVRARRTLYDCMSANYVEIATGQSPSEPSSGPGLVRINKIRTNSALPAMNTPKQAPRKVSADFSGAGASLMSTTEVMNRIHEQVQKKCGPYVLALSKQLRRDQFEPQRAGADMMQVLEPERPTASNGDLLQTMDTQPVAAQPVGTIKREVLIGR